MEGLIFGILQYSIFQFPSRSKSDQHQFFPKNNINTYMYSRKKVMRINKMISKGKNSSIFGQILHTNSTRNLCRSVEWRICILHARRYWSLTISFPTTSFPGEADNLLLSYVKIS